MSTPPSARAAAEPPVLTLGDLLEIVRRHRLLATGAGLGVALLVLIAGLGRTPLYEARATIALDRTRQPTESRDGNVDVRLGLYEHDLLNTQRNILLSGNLLKTALRSDAFLTNETYAGAADPVDRLGERLSVSTSRDSWDLTLGLRDERPERAEAGLQAIIDAYQSRHLRTEKDRADNAITFLERQVAESERTMIGAREAQQAFQRSNGLVVLDAERSMPAQRLQSLNSRKVVLAQQTSALEILVTQINAIDAVAEPEERMTRFLALDLVNRHPTVVEQLKLLYQLQTELSQLQEKYLERHPRLIEQRSRIATKRQHLIDAVAAIRAGVLSDHAKLTGQMDGLGRDIGAAEGEFNAYRENLFTLQTHIIQTKAAEEQYAGLLKRLNEERIHQRLSSQQLSVTDAPRARGKAVNINGILTMALAMVLGGVAAVATPLLASFFGRRAHDADEIRALIGAPVVAELPFIGGLQPVGANGSQETDPKLAEAFRGLRTALRLTQRQEGDQGEVIVVTSCDTGEGKSTTAARLAISMASSGIKVLLVDGDLRNPAIGDELGQVCDRGLSELLRGEPGISPAATTYPNLDLVDAGVPVPNPGELLGSHCLPEWLVQCRSSYDCIIIDSPPLRWFSDALVLGTQADRLLFVVREGSTQRSSLEKARAQLMPLGNKPVEVVLLTRQGLGRLPFYSEARYVRSGRGTQRSGSRVG
jgi:capsular exopolysaccharide synthesis family protein